MTSPGESKGRRALAALSELARGSVHPPTHAELDGGLRTLRAQMEAKRARRRGWTIRAAFAGTVVAAAFLAVGVVRTGRSPRLCRSPTRSATSGRCRNASRG